MHHSLAMLASFVVISNHGCSLFRSNIEDLYRARLVMFFSQSCQALNAQASSTWGLSLLLSPVDGSIGLGSQITSKHFSKLLLTAADLSMGYSQENGTVVFAGAFIHTERTSAHTRKCGLARRVLVLLAKGGTLCPASGHPWLCAWITQCLHVPSAESRIYMHTVRMLLCCPCVFFLSVLGQNFPVHTAGTEGATFSSGDSCISLMWFTQDFSGNLWADESCLNVTYPWFYIWAPNLFFFCLDPFSTQYKSWKLESRK